MPCPSVVKVRDNRLIVTLTRLNGQDIQGVILITGESAEKALYRLFSPYVLELINRSKSIWRTRLLLPI
jgi:hypothetical protein